jgi:phosphopantothenoylcysteine synthetase/decarboxylase
MDKGQRTTDKGQLMHFLVTAGNTQTPIDRVRCLTNIFTGRTGTLIACQAHERGHQVTFLTSHPERIAECIPGPPLDRWLVKTYRTFDDLQRLLERTIPRGSLDAVVHCAAVSDYRAAGIFAPARGTHLDAEGQWCSENLTPPSLIDRAAGKIKSNDPELWLRLVRTPKLIDRFRAEWGFQGILVKFKLEVSVDDGRLLEAAERSRLQSQADLMVANTLEGASQWAFIGPVEDLYQRVSRADLADRLLGQIEAIFKARHHG